MTFPIDYAKRPRAQRLYHTHSVATAAATARAAILSGEAPGSAARIAAARRSRRRAAAARNSKPFASINCRACERRFTPQMDAATRARKWAGWQDAVRRTLTPQ